MANADIKVVRTSGTFRQRTRTIPHPGPEHDIDGMRAQFQSQIHKRDQQISSLNLELKTKTNYADCLLTIQQFYEESTRIKRREKDQWWKKCDVFVNDFMTIANQFMSLGEETTDDGIPIKQGIAKLQLFYTRSILNELKEEKVHLETQIEKLKNFEEKFDNVKSRDALKEEIRNVEKVLEFVNGNVRENEEMLKENEKGVKDKHETKVTSVNYEITRGDLLKYTKKALQNIQGLFERKSRENPAMAQRMFKLLEENKRLTKHIQEKNHTNAANTSESSREIFELKLKIDELKEIIRKRDHDQRLVNELTHTRTNNETLMRENNALGRYKEVVMKELHDAKENVKRLTVENEDLKKQIESFDGKEGDILRQKNELEKIIKSLNEAALKTRETVINTELKMKYLLADYNQVRTENTLWERQIKNHANIVMGLEKRIEDLQKSLTKESDTVKREQQECLRVTISMRKLELDHNRTEMDLKQALTQLTKVKSESEEQKIVWDKDREESGNMRKEIKTLTTKLHIVQNDLEVQQEENTLLNANIRRLKLNEEELRASLEEEKDTFSYLKETNQNNQREIDSLRSEVDSLSQRKFELEQKVTELKNELESSSGSLHRDRMSLHTVMEDKSQLQGQVDELCIKISALEKKLETMTTRKNELEIELDDTIKLLEKEREKTRKMTDDNRHAMVWKTQLEEKEGLYGDEQIKTQSLMKEIEELLVSRKKVEDELNETDYELKSKLSIVETLTSRLEELRGKYEKLNSEFKLLDEKNKELLADKNTLVKQKTENSHKKKELASELKELNQQLQKERERANKLQQEKYDTQAENANLRSQRDEALHKYNDGFSAQTSEITSLKSQLSKERSQNETTISESKTLRGKNSSNEDTIKQLKAELKQAQSTLAENLGLVKRLEEDQRTAQASMEEQLNSNTDKKVIEELTNENKELKATIKSTEREKKKVETEITQLTTKLETVQKLNKDAEGKATKIKKDFEKANELLKAEKERANKLVTEAQKLQNDIKELRKQKNNLDKSASGVEGNVKELEDKIKLLENANGKLKIDNKSMEQTIKKKNSEIEKMVTAQKEQDATMQGLKKELEGAKKNKDATGAKQQESLKNLEKEKSELQKEIEKLQETSNQEKEKLRSEMEKQNQLSKEELEKMAQNIKDLEAKNVSAEEKVKKLTGYIEDAKALYKKAKEKINELTQEKELMGASGGDAKVAKLVEVNKQLKEELAKRVGELKKMQTIMAMMKGGMKKQ